MVTICRCRFLAVWRVCLSPVRWDWQILLFLIKIWQFFGILMKTSESIRIYRCLLSHLDNNLPGSVRTIRASSREICLPYSSTNKHFETWQYAVLFSFRNCNCPTGSGSSCISTFFQVEDILPFSNFLLFYVRAK